MRITESEKEEKKNEQKVKMISHSFNESFDHDKKYHKNN